MNFMFRSQVDPVAKARLLEARQKEHFLRKQGFYTDDPAGQGAPSVFGSPIWDWARASYAEREAMAEVKQHKEKIAELASALAEKSKRSDKISTWARRSEIVMVSCAFVVVSLALASPLIISLFGLPLLQSVANVFVGGLLLGGSAACVFVFKEARAKGEVSSLRGEKSVHEYGAERDSQPYRKISRQVQQRRQELEVAAAEGLCFSADGRRHGWNKAALATVRHKLISSFSRNPLFAVMGVSAKQAEVLVDQLMVARGFVLPQPAKPGASPEEVGRVAAERVRVLRRATRVLAKVL